MICFCLHHLPLCWLFCILLDNCFHIYHWLCCQFICWFILVQLWSCGRFYCMFQVDILLILHYCDILCLLYLWCIFCLMRRLFQCFQLKFLHCYYLSSLTHIRITEFDCFRYENFFVNYLMPHWPFKNGMSIFYHWLVFIGS